MFQKLPLEVIAYILLFTNFRIYRTVCKFFKQHIRVRKAIGQTISWKRTVRGCIAGNFTRLNSILQSPRKNTILNEMLLLAVSTSINLHTSKLIIDYVKSIGYSLNPMYVHMYDKAVSIAYNNGDFAKFAYLLDSKIHIPGGETMESICNRESSVIWWYLHKSNFEYMGRALRYCLFENILINDFITVVSHPNITNYNLYDALEFAINHQCNRNIINIIMGHPNYIHDPKLVMRMHIINICHYKRYCEIRENSVEFD